MKFLILVCLFISFSPPSIASVYLAVSMSSINQLDTTGEDDQNKDLLLNGNGFSTYLGYKFSFLAFEIFHKTVKGDSTKEATTFDYSDTITGIGARLYFLGILNIKAGTMNHDAKGELKTGSTVILDYKSKSSSSYIGLGARIPVTSFDVFGEPCLCHSR